MTYAYKSRTFLIQRNFKLFFSLPVYTVAGTALMGTFITSVAGVSFYQAIALLYPHMSVTPDLLLGLLFGLSGMAGMSLV